MLAVLIGLAGALIFGSADFIGGIASKRISSVRVTAVGGLSGLAVLLLALPAIGGTWSSKAVLLGAISGVSGSLAIVLLYACLAIGPMSILSPVTAVVSALVPALAGVLRGERLNGIAYVALALALVAVVLVGFVPEKGAVRPSLKALGMAVASGALIGFFLIVIDLTPADSGLVPLVVNRTVNASIMFSVVLIAGLLSRSRPRERSAGGRLPAAGWRPGLWLAIAGGAVDATANALLLLGLRIGDLTVQSVLTALYPAGTIILAAVVLKERIAPVQIVGLVLALVAAAMLAIA
ncbi:EamA family transporter [Lacisediminihabitans profunda]|uniref:EamA family transporter n=1 Tax=Lacisediminihabitans profunda TaxID=2594790 RepID=A0A5C8UQA1_9MICO|nr:EamA family transporter [Lacisediminihabitans profunda]TXN30449.1 EamA family transporter [Lacisediminihabitans profunda]